MRVLAILVCSCLSFLLVGLLFASCLTRGWWVSLDERYNAGLWVHCSYFGRIQKCETFDIKFYQTMPTNSSKQGEQDLIEDEASRTNHLNQIRGCSVVSLVFAICMLAFETILLYFARRQTQVKFACWLKLITILCNFITTAMTMAGCILARNYSAIFMVEMELKGSWLCMVVACALNILIGVCLIAMLLKKTSDDETNTKTNSSSKRKRALNNHIPIHLQFGTQVNHSNSVKRSNSPPFVIPAFTTTPYHNHPYVQYHVDSINHKNPGRHLEMSDNFTSASAENLKIALSNMSDYSTDQLADFSLEELPSDRNQYSTFVNRTHSYDDVVLEPRRSEIL